MATLYVVLLEPSFLPCIDLTKEYVIYVEGEGTIMFFNLADYLMSLTMILFRLNYVHTFYV